MVLYADPPGMRATGNPPTTIPDITLVTPDIVVIEQNNVTLIELEIPHNSLESPSKSWKESDTIKYK